MDRRRCQLSRDAVASTSGAYIGQHFPVVGLLRQRRVASATRPTVSQRFVALPYAPLARRAGTGVSAINPATTVGASSTQSLPQSEAAAVASTLPSSQLQPQPLQQQSNQSTQNSGDVITWPLSAERVRRLNTLVETRRLYRNIVRAEYLLSLPSPLYTSPALATGEQAEGGFTASTNSGSSGAGTSISVSVAGGSTDADPDRVSSGGIASLNSFSGIGSISGAIPSLRSPEEDKALKSALDSVAEMALVLEQLKASLRSLTAGFGASVFSLATASASEETVWEVARQNVLGLRERLAAELPLLPISSDVAIHYIESRNAKFSRRVALDELQGGAANGISSGGSSTTSGGSGSNSSSVSTSDNISVGNAAGSINPGAELVGGAGSSAMRATPLERLEAAERVAGEIIANRIKPALKRASEQDLLQVVQGTGSYLKGLWVRLNGGTPASGRWGGWKGVLAGRELPQPEGTQQRSELAISQLSLDLEALEKRLQDASKKRENKLRKAGLQGRVQMAIQLKGLDAEVLHLSSLLAVRTLQLEMEHVYGSLEAEALDVFNGLQPGGLLARDGSTNELALLVAEFTLLDEQLTLMAAALEGLPASAATGEEGVTVAAAAAAAMGPALINDEVLSKLAVEIPDMRSRVGVADQVVFGGQGFSLTKARLQIRESLDKVKEAVTFLTRGFKLLGSDIATGSRLFLKAALGNTLKPREVSALRRTARDLLTFIPFTIILIIPLSPLGHVLVFGFIQRYFPSFFPSQFSSRRQDIMVRYEELERQLLEAQAAAEAAEEEVELARAREAVARLMAPEPPAAALVEVVAGSGALALQVGDGPGTGTTATAVGGGSLRGLGSAGTGRVGTSEAAEAAVAAGPGGIAPTAGHGGGGSSGSGMAAIITPFASASAASSVDEVTLHEATKKVRILAEQLDEIRDDVHLIDPLSESNGPDATGNTITGTSSSQAHGNSGDGTHGQH